LSALKNQNTVAANMHSTTAFQFLLLNRKMLSMELKKRISRPCVDVLTC
jgi:hypothetical protein